MTFKDHELENQDYLLYWTFSGQCPSIDQQRGISCNLIPPKSLLLHKTEKMQFPSSLNCEIKAVARGDSDNTTAGVQVFEIMSSWLNDCKEQILFLVTIHLKRGFSENTVCEHW